MVPNNKQYTHVLGTNTAKSIIKRYNAEFRELESEITESLSTIDNFEKESCMNEYLAGSSFRTEFELNNAFNNFINHTIKYLQRIYNYRNLIGRLQDLNNGLIALKSQLQLPVQNKRIEYFSPNPRSSQAILSAIDTLTDHMQEPINNYFAKIDSVMMSFIDYYHANDQFKKTIDERLTSHPELAAFANHWLNPPALIKPKPLTI